MDLDKLLEEEEALNQAKEGLSVVKNVSNVCKYCKSSQIDQNFVKLFKLKPLYSEYKLITKTRAKEEFLLNEKQLNSLKSIKIDKGPEVRSRERRLRLFLMSQVEDKAIEVYGSYRDLAIAKLNKTKERLLKKRKLKQQTSRNTKAPENGSNSSSNGSASKRIRQALDKYQTKLHEHVFELENGIKKCIECNFEVELELL